MRKIAMCMTEFRESFSVSIDIVLSVLKLGMPRCGQRHSVVDDIRSQRKVDRLVVESVPS